MELNDIFDFGKFKGLSLKQVMVEHGSYVGWCLENKIFLTFIYNQKM